MPNIMESRKCVFVRIPRTASTSILETLKFGTHTGHLPASELKSILGASWDGYFSFTFVRNPWERVVSEYFYLLDRKIELPDFKAFVMSQGFYHRWEGSEIRQLPYLIEDGKIIVNFIGRFEHLQRDFAFVCDRIDIHPPRLAHHAGSKHDHYRTYFDTESKQVVDEFFSADIEAFGYEF